MKKTQTKIYLFEILGKLVVSFQGLERSVEGLIFGSMTSSYSQMRILMSEMSFKSKVHVMSSLIKDLHDSQEVLFSEENIYEKLDEIVKRCHQCESRRNQLIHSFWVPEFKSSPDSVMRIKESSKSTKGYKYSVESVEHGSLNEDIHLIEKTRDDLDDFCQKLSIQFNRVHGLTGMAHCCDHAMLVETIYQSVIDKAQVDDEKNI
ncbi:hypothetical protein ACXWTF_07660 [Thiomicrolovo sp. ZZH C-3]